ncbi:alpha-amylase family glycosyl hydrolase [Methanolobus sp. ZRKC3]|uniref:alpha-amylase family glycosyl hydrolase n=1 Tax=Methanolobus sp. ZRKC3 TaxID=3125786 RepID=UPI003255F5F4
MFKIEETGPQIQGNDVRFRIDLPGIEQEKGFSAKVYVINKRGQFDVNIAADVYELKPEIASPDEDELWGEIARNRWCSDLIQMESGTYLYRFEISGPEQGNGNKVRSLYFGDPCARETDAGVFSVFHVPVENPAPWEDGTFKLPPLDEVILYELNVAEFGGTFAGVAERIPYLLSLGINVIELLPINSIAEPTRWGYMPIFYFAPEERFGGPAGFRHLVQECHRNGIAVILDMVYAHTDRMFPYQIGYERFFQLWYDDHYSDEDGLHHAPNPLVSAYDNFGKKNDWRMQSAQEFFAAVNAFWLREYHIDGFRYDHVNGYLDRKPIERNGGIDWYSQENRPTFLSLQDLSKATYQESRNYPRFLSTPEEASRIIQIGEDLRESAYQLSPASASAINGCWEKRLSDVAKNMAVGDILLGDLGKELLLTDERFDEMGYTGEKNVGDDTIPAMVVQFIESHDECRLFYMIQNQKDCGDTGFEYRNGLDGQPWWKLQPYAIALMTSVGIPMLWAGQEFAENTGLTEGGMVRVRGFRPLHWDYFYNVESSTDGATVLPLVNLYRKLGNLRRKHAALRATRENAREEYCNLEDKVLVYRRWKNEEVLIIILNFSDQEREIPVPFGHTGIWVDILEASYDNVNEPYSISVSDSSTHELVSIPANFGRILRLES